MKGFYAEARKRMLVHPWSGNVRELKRTVRSAVLFTDGDVITADKLNFEEPLLSGETSFFLKNVEMEKRQIIRALKQADGNRSLAAELLGIGRQVARLRRGNSAARLARVTRKVLSNSKHTLLLPLFGSNRKAFG